MVLCHNNADIVPSCVESLVAQRGRHDYEIAIVDTRWLSPLPKAALTQAVAGCRHILIVDETRHSGGVAEALMAHFHETAPGATLARLTAEDSFIATGPAYAATMPSSAGIADAALRLTGKG